MNCSAVFRGDTSEIGKVGTMLHDYTKGSGIPGDLQVSSVEIRTIGIYKENPKILNLPSAKAAEHKHRLVKLNL